MTTVPADAPPNSDPRGGGVEEGGGVKKKKNIKAVIQVPPDVATGYLLVRAALTGVLGMPMTSSDKHLKSAYASAFQNMFLKDPHTGKFSLNLGKKRGEELAAVPLPETDEDVARLWDAIESACDALASSSSLITVRRMPLCDILEHYGATVLDASHGKLKPDMELEVAQIGDVLIAVPPGLPFASVSDQWLKVRIDRAQSSVLAGKKARKAEVTIKYIVHMPADVEAPPLAEIDSNGTAHSLTLEHGWSQSEIRFAQGHELKAAMAAAEQATEVPEAAVAPTTATTDGAPKVHAANDSDAHAGEDDDMVVNIETVAGKIDYNKLVVQFGSSLLTEDLLNSLQAATTIPLHRFLRRNIFFSHRDLHALLENRTKGSQFYLYTGRGPSSEAMHLGHLVPFLFTKYLQDAFGVPLVIQMTDDEKFIFKGEYDEDQGYNLEHFQRLTIENAKDIVACGFDYEKTFIFSDMDYVGNMYPNIVKIWKASTVNKVNACFGFDGTSNSGKIAFPAIQAAPSFASSFPNILQPNMLCLIPCAIDQDPYFRLTRDVAHKLVPKSHPLGGKPALIHSKFFPPLQGATGKMSSSDLNSAIFLTDTPQDIERKIKQHAFSGGQDTKEKQQELGANLEEDVSYQWLRFFLEDDSELEQIGKEYSTGSGTYWSTGAVKNKLIEVLKDLVRQHQERRAQITDEDVRKWMQPRNIMG